MQGSLALSSGVLWVARAEPRVRVRPYDLDGRVLGEGFFVPDSPRGRCELRALALDPDRRLWLADARAGALRAFSVFGAELPGIQSAARAELDVAGALGVPCGVAASGIEDEAQILVASSGERRHALHLIEPAHGRVVSLRPEGNPQSRFHGLAGVCLSGRIALACERRAGRVQAFRDGEFHYLFRAPLAAPFEPSAVALLRDGRMLVAQAGDASALFLFAPGGQLLRTLAECGEAGGAVLEPSAIAVEEGATERDTRIAVIDCDGDRVQVFTLDGRCFGAFPDLPRAAP